MNSIVKLLREIRIEKKISQESLATRAGFGINQIWNWENGQTCPTLDNAIAWAEALGYEFDLHIKEPANV
mgnify:FL=1